MTQNGGLDVLIAWVVFAAFVLLLGRRILRHHRDAARCADDSDRLDERARSRDRDR
ncbi:hypothetical protein HJ588_17395 [Flexivirga sp. ID2601S]|uniref:CcmD family protein n=1 Tax=Flexivirga aerilata TaxID=1656889 RepID=A0A849ANF5_9MICO|nr:hypothetical protein [Flexivirga aerilata]NNG41036.1 hypothetical protein [Flexivirga aerilata]